ncbi:MAG TPA: hypothetical protein VGR69_08635 [Candidatus Rubrimentiphilum sp.]|nr:hypothetical protein [Candidatus Rubrimentiphilum sp.]
MKIVKTYIAEVPQPQSQLALPENRPAPPTILRERVTTIPARSGVFSGWGPAA